MAKLIKYPRTHHLPWSPGRSRDDLVLDNVEHFEAMDRVVVTEKLDGENTTLYRDHLHARSLDSKSHPSRNWLKGFHASMSYLIPEDVRICGENVYARHSVDYSRLTTYFYVFGIYRGEKCLGWKATKELCSNLQLELVPVLYEGAWDEESVRACWRGVSLFGQTQEGYVVRNALEFPFSSFRENVAKSVRPSHVNSEIHWMNAPIEPNKLEGT